MYIWLPFPSKPKSRDPRMFHSFSYCQHLAECQSTSRHKNYLLNTGKEDGRKGGRHTGREVIGLEVIQKDRKTMKNRNYGYNDNLQTTQLCWELLLFTVNYLWSNKKLSQTISLSWAATHGSHPRRSLLYHHCTVWCMSKYAVRN